MRLISNHDIKTYDKQSKVALACFLAEFPNLLASVISAVLAQNVLVALDCFESLETTVHFFLLFWISSNLKKETGDRYNFGIERVETFTSFICELFILIGYLAVCLLSIYRLFRPTRPQDALALFLILKLFNIAFDIYFYIRHRRLKKEYGSRINETETSNCQSNLIIDIVTGVILCVCYFLRDERWSWYISPVATLALSGYFFTGDWNRLREVAADLSDTSIPVAEQDNLFDIVLEHAAQIRRVYAVNCRMLNHKLYVDIELSFAEDVTFAEEKELLEQIDARIQDRYPGSTTRFVLGKDM